ncbi:MAG: B12-binding domain-containing radical SAM protein [Candidatus Competibacteraceae bacterium]|nr:B12-binding domain-containing radical SAM protein [Candidatus Competibacteraceae bacterium]
MKALLTVPRYRKPYKTNEFPLGLAYISSVLKKAGHQVKSINLNFEKGSTETIIREAISSFQPDMLGTGGMSPQYPAIQELLLASQKASSEILLAVGGSVVSGDPVPAMQTLECDIGIIGEGEDSILEIAAWLDDNRKPDVRKTRGLAIKDRSGQIFVTDSRPPIDDLDRLPLPDYDGFDLATYIETQSATDSHYTYLFDRPGVGAILTSRSCPLTCTFCFHPLSKTFRERSLDSCFEEIDLLVNRYKINILNIHDELFTNNRKRLRDFCARIKPYNLRWNVPLRVNAINLDTLLMMKDSGCFNVSMGIESMNENVLISMKKHTKPEQIQHALEATRKADINVVGNLIFGDPEENLDTATESLDWWKKHPEYNLALRFITPFPGTELYFNLLMSGRIESATEYLKNGCPIVNMTNLDDDDFVSLLAHVWRTHAVADNHLKALNVRCQPSIKPTLLSIEGNLFDIEFTCPACGASNNYTNYQVGADSIHGCIPTIWCRHCNQKMLLFDYPLSKCPDDLIDTVTKSPFLSRIYSDWTRLLEFDTTDWLHRLSHYIDPKILDKHNVPTHTSS